MFTDCMFVVNYDLFYFQHPMVIKNVLSHCKWLLEQRGVPIDDVLPVGGPMGGPPMPPGKFIQPDRSKLQ